MLKIKEVKSMESDKIYITPNLEKGVLINESIITIAASDWSTGSPS